MLDALSKYPAPLILHSDQGSEYLSYRLRNLCQKLEITLSCSDRVSPWQNGFKERFYEVQQMLDWQQEWNYLTTDSSDPHAGHAMESGGSMGDDMANMEAQLEGLSGEVYDNEFLKQMILHHQQAVDMSNYADTNALHPELKDFALTVISAQEKEIADMKSWQQQ